MALIRNQDSGSTSTSVVRNRFSAGLKYQLNYRNFQYSYKINILLSILPHTFGRLLSDRDCSLQSECIVIAIRWCRADNFNLLICFGMWISLEINDYMHIICMSFPMHSKYIFQVLVLERFYPVAILDLFEDGPVQFYLTSWQFAMCRSFNAAELSRMREIISDLRN